MNGSVTKAVWSFWAPPMRHGPGSWLHDIDHFCAWHQSVHIAREWFDHLELVTDSVGKSLLIDLLKLPFNSVKVCLDDVNVEPSFWAAGKIYAYAQQDTPFVHVDADVFLTKPLPQRLLEARLCCQAPEPFSVPDETYKPEVIADAITAARGYLPEQWTWYMDNRTVLSGLNAGILGGTDVDLFQCYTHDAIRMLEHPRHQAVWADLQEHHNHMVDIEQYLIAAHCAQRKVPVMPLFPDHGVAHDHQLADQTGYIHLMGSAKRNEFIRRRLHDRVRGYGLPIWNRCIEATHQLRQWRWRAAG